MPTSGQPVANAVTSEPVYCCFGCRLAESITRSDGDVPQPRGVLSRLGLSIFFSMNVLVFSMALWAYDPNSSADRVTAIVSSLFRYLCLLFSLPVLFLLGGPMLASAIEALRRGVLSTDLLLLLGVAASYVGSTIAVFTERGHVYFEVGCVVLVFVTLGRWLEAIGKHQTNQAMDALARLLPARVRVRRAEAGGPESVAIPIEEVRAGDVAIVPPGGTVPCDGKLASAHASVDEQLLTGESTPISKERGDPLFAGSCNLELGIEMLVAAPASMGTVARLLDLVRQARQAKGRYQLLADRVSSGFLPLVVVVAIGSGVAHSATRSIEQGVHVSLAVLLIACPCALGLATPMAIWAAMGNAGAHQVVFRNGSALEKLARVRAVRFDKTGTLTTGRPRVVDGVLAVDADPRRVLGVAGSLCRESSHPLAGAIADHLMSLSDPETRPAELDDVRVTVGQGIAGLIDGRLPVAMGSPAFLHRQGMQATGTIQSAITDFVEGGRSVVAVGVGESIDAVFAFEHQLRPEARDAIAALRNAGLDVGVLTGDHAERGRRLARELGIEVDSELSPEGKVDRLRRLRRQIGLVAMVGDGINDAPALAASDVGIALGCGADMARASADVCLLADDLRRIPWTIELSRRTVRTIGWNLVWAFGYNTVGVGVAAAGLLHPVLAALAMGISSALVVSNSLRLAERKRSPLGRSDDAGAVESVGELTVSARRNDTIGSITP